MIDMQNEDDEAITSDQSGGVNITDGARVNVSGDLVGRDKITTVVKGKNVIHVGTLVIPTWPVLIGALLLSATLAVLLLRPRGPTQMTGEFNIAVAEFGQMGADRQAHPSEDGRNLSQWLFERLQTEFAGLSPGVAVQVWHDSLELGVDIGIVPGATAEARAEAAAQLAQKIGADIVIYGNLDTDQTPASFIPEFYVADLPEAGEIVGQYELGAPIPVQVPIDRLGSRLQVNQKLTARAKALTLFTIGLAWEFAGSPAKALDSFRQAEQVADWADDEGKEVVYLFIGREAHFLWREGEDGEAEVQQAFRNALALNPDYARAHIGLGNFYHEKAQRLVVQQNLDPAGLEQVFSNVEQAIAEYRSALDSALQPPANKRLEITARLALGGANRLKGQAYLRQGENDAAVSQFDLAIQEAESAQRLIGETDYRDLGLVYQGMGTAYQLKAHTRFAQGNREEGRALYEEAVRIYQQCIELADAQPFDWFLQQIKTDACVPYKQWSEDALAGLQEGSP